MKGKNEYPHIIRAFQEVANALVAGIALLVSGWAVWVHNKMVPVAARRIPTFSGFVVVVVLSMP